MILQSPVSLMFPGFFLTDLNFMKLPSAILFIQLVAVLVVSCAGTGSDGRGVATQQQQELVDPALKSKSGSGSSPQAAIKSGEITVISIEHLYNLKQQDQVLLIDCRKPLFHRLGSIEGSVNIPRHQFESSFAEVKPKLDAAVEADQVVVLYCLNKKCPIAYNVAQQLSKLGYSVTIFDAGWEEWKRSGLE